MKAISSLLRPLGPWLALGLLGSCAAPPHPAPPPAPPPAPAPAPRPPAPTPRPSDWRDAPQTPGVWRWSVVGGRSTASFGVTGQAPVAMLSCDRTAGKVLLARSGSATAPVPMELTTDRGSRPLLSDPQLSPPGWLVTPIAARDPLLDAAAFTRGRFMLDVAGLAPLYLPSWPEVSRVIEDCR